MVDHTTKNVYLTESIKMEKGGVVRFTDAKAGSQVTLQNSQVKEITKE